MGFLGALYLGLFVWCLQKAKEKSKIKERLIALLIVGAINVLLAFIFYSMGTTTEDKEGAWIIIPMYIIFFGWRIVLDIISYNKHVGYCETDATDNNHIDTDN